MKKANHGENQINVLDWVRFLSQAPYEDSSCYFGLGWVGLGWVGFDSVRFGSVRLDSVGFGWV